jgi:hypothetical protein
MKLKVEMIKKLIESQLRLFAARFVNGHPELKDILQQMIHGTKATKSIKLYQFLMEAFLYTGGSDQSNYSHYRKQKVKPSFNRIKKALLAAECPKLVSFDSYIDCGYRKTARTCNKPDLLETCPLPKFDMKRGGLNQMVFSLYFFLRDICQNDFYQFVKDHFDQGKQQVKERVQGFIETFSQVYNVGPKLVDMAFSHLFFTQYLGWDYRAVGAEMVAIDTLVHNFLQRTGTLDEYKKPHKYGVACHTQKGCLGAIEEIAQEIDCREYNPNYPTYFPRLVQLYIWAYCSVPGENICNGNKCKEGKPNRECDFYRQKLCLPIFRGEIELIGEGKNISMVE